MHTHNAPKTFPLSRLSLAVALISLTPVVAAEGTLLDPISVEAQADKAPLSGTSTLDAKTVQQRSTATDDTASLLRDVPGLSLNGAGGVSSLPAIHGLADDRLRIKLDGMDLIATCPNHMNPPLSYLDPSNVGTLQVFAGIAPVSVGGDSIGGTIIAETPAPEFAASGEQSFVRGEVGASYRSNNDARGANLSATFANEIFNLSYSGAWSKADNYTAADDFKTTTATGRPGHTLPLDEVGSTAYETQNHTLGLAFKLGEDLLEAKLGYQDMPEQLYPNQRMDLLDNTQKRVNLRWLGAFDWGELDTRVYHETVEHHMNFGPDRRFWYGPNSQPPAAAAVGTACSPIGFMTCASGMPMVSESDTTGATMKAEVNISTEDVVRVGTEFQRYRLDDYWTPSGGGMWPGTFLNVNDGKRDRAAVFAEWESQISPSLLTLIGLRYERVTMDADAVQGYKTTLPAPGNQIAEAAAFNAQDRKQTDNNVDVTLLASYEFDANFDVEFGMARKVRSPNLYERYTWSTWPMPASMNNLVGDGNGYVGDIDLEPEKAHTISATFDWHAADRQWELKATPYYTRVSDYIDAVRRPGWAPNQFNVLQFANQSARLYGIDISGRMPLDNNDWGAWGLKGLLNYTDGKNRDSDGDLYNIMPLNAKLTLTHARGGWNNAIEVVMVDDKDDVSEVRNEIDTSGYTLVNLRGSHSWKQVRIDFGVENLFDKSYSLPTGGTYTGQGSTMQLNGIPWGIAVPGMGRSIYAGVNMAF